MNLNRPRQATTGQAQALKGKQRCDTLDAKPTTPNKQTCPRMKTAHTDNASWISRSTPAILRTAAKSRRAMELIGSVLNLDAQILPGIACADSQEAIHLLAINRELASTGKWGTTESILRSTKTPADPHTQPIDPQQRIPILGATLLGPHAAYAKAGSASLIHAMSSRCNKDALMKTILEIAAEGGRQNPMGSGVIIQGHSHPLGLFNPENNGKQAITRIIQRARRYALIRKRGLIGRILPLPEPAQCGASLCAMGAYASSSLPWDDKDWRRLLDGNLKHAAATPLRKFMSLAGPNGNDPSIAMVLAALNDTINLRLDVFPLENLIAQNAAICPDPEHPWNGFLLENDQGVCALDILGAASDAGITGLREISEQIMRAGKPQPNQNPRAQVPDLPENEHVILAWEGTQTGDPAKRRALKKLAMAMEWLTPESNILGRFNPTQAFLCLCRIRHAIRIAQRSGLDLNHVLICRSPGSGRGLMQTAEHPIHFLLRQWKPHVGERNSHTGKPGKMDGSDSNDWRNDTAIQATALVLDACNDSALTGNWQIPFCRREANRYNTSKPPTAPLGDLLLRIHILGKILPEPIVTRLILARGDAPESDMDFGRWIAQTLIMPNLKPKQATRAFDLLVAMGAQAIEKPDPVTNNTIMDIVREAISHHKKHLGRKNDGFATWKAPTMEAMQNGLLRLEGDVIRDGVKKQGTQPPANRNPNSRNAIAMPEKTTCHPGTVRRMPCQE